MIYVAWIDKGKPSERRLLSVVADSKKEATFLISDQLFQKGRMHVFRAWVASGKEVQEEKGDAHE